MERDDKEIIFLDGKSPIIAGRSSVLDLLASQGKREGGKNGTMRFVYKCLNLLAGLRVPTPE